MMKRLFLGILALTLLASLPAQAFDTRATSAWVYDMTTPVSYTHLDVYKRQDQDMTNVPKEPVFMPVCLLVYFCFLFGNVNKRIRGFLWP